jgi:hypothetical protein
MSSNDYPAASADPTRQSYSIVAECKLKVHIYRNNLVMFDKVSDHAIVLAK